MSALAPRVQQVLANALPHVDVAQLFQNLNNLLGSQGNYTLVGSTCMHLHALEHPNATCSLPKPNDLDLVLNETALHKIELANTNTLKSLNLTRDANHRHVLFFECSGKPPLKIDMIGPTTQGFEKYNQNPHAIHGVRVGRLPDTMVDYRRRASDPKFILKHGSAELAEAAIAPWVKYFDTVTLGGPTKLDTNQLKRGRASSDSESEERAETVSQRPPKAARRLFG